MAPQKTRYKFSHRAGGRYYWVAVTPASPGDSRYDHVSCKVEAFWGRPVEFPEDEHGKWDVFRLLLGQRALTGDSTWEPGSPGHDSIREW